MKSIKEKAEEHAPYTREDSWNKIQRCMIARKSFEACANYVLDEIEKKIPSSDDVLENHTKRKSAIFRLQSIIEQLKK